MKPKFKIGAMLRVKSSQPGRNEGVAIKIAPSADGDCFIYQIQWCGAWGINGWYKESAFIELITPYDVFLDMLK